MKLCPKCKIEKDTRAFSKGTPWCKSCKSKYDTEHRKKPAVQAKARKEHYKEHLYRQYKLRIEELAELIAKQGGKCGVCQKGLDDVYDFTIKKYNLVVDHDHSCCPGNKSCGKCIRGILCRDCNLMLGHSRDNVKTLKKAIKYLKKAGK